MIFGRSAGVYNLLSAADSSFETGVGSWVGNTGAWLTTVAQSSVASLYGSYSLAITEGGGAGAGEAVTSP